MGQATSAGRGTSGSVKQLPCLESRLRDEAGFTFSSNNGGGGGKLETDSVNSELLEHGSQVFRSYHVKDRIDSLIEAYLTENSETHTTLSDSDDNAQTVTSTEETVQDPSSSSLADCEHQRHPFTGGDVCTFASKGHAVCVDEEWKSDVVDSTNSPPDSELDIKLVNGVHQTNHISSGVDDSILAVKYVGNYQAVRSTNMEETSKMAAMCVNPRGVPPISSNSGSMSRNSSGSSLLSGVAEMDQWRQKGKRIIKLQTLIDKVLETSLGSPNAGEENSSGLLKSLSDVENDEKEMDRLRHNSGQTRNTSRVSEKAPEQNIYSEHEHPKAACTNKAPKVEFGGSKHVLENFKNNIEKAVSARLVKPPRDPVIMMGEPQQEVNSGVRSGFTKHEAVPNHREPVVNHQDSVANHRQALVNHRASMASHRESMTNCREPLVNHHDSMTNHREQMVNPRDSVTNHRDPVTSHNPSSTNHNPSRHQDVKGIINVQQIIDRVMKNEFGSDEKSGPVEKPASRSSAHPYNSHAVHASPGLRDHRAGPTVTQESSNEGQHRPVHKDHHYNPYPTGYSMSQSQHRMAQEGFNKRVHPTYHSTERLSSNAVASSRDYMNRYVGSRPNQGQVAQKSPSRDVPARPQSASYPSSESNMESMHSRSESFSHGTNPYKRHSPPPLVRIADDPRSHPHGQQHHHQQAQQHQQQQYHQQQQHQHQYPSKYPPDHCLPPPAKIRKEHHSSPYHDRHHDRNHDAGNLTAVNRDVSHSYPTPPHIQLGHNPMHMPGPRAPEAIHMRPMYPVAVPMTMPAFRQLGPLPGPRTVPWVGAAEHGSIHMQSLRHPIPGHPVHVSPRYPVSKPSSMNLPQRLPSPVVVRDSLAPPPHHSMGLSHHPASVSRNNSPSVVVSKDTRPRLQSGSITKGTPAAPPPQPLPAESSEPKPIRADPGSRGGRSSEEQPLDLSKKPTSSPSPATVPASDRPDPNSAGRQALNGDPNCMSTHIKSLEESVEKYFHNFTSNKVPMDRLALPEGVGEHTAKQLYLQHHLMAEAHAQAQAQAHAQAQQAAHAQAQAHAHAQVQAQAQVQARAQAQIHQAQVQAYAHAQAQSQSQVHAQSQAQMLQLHSPTGRDGTPSREASFANSPRPVPRHDTAVPSPRPTPPHCQSSVICSPPMRNNPPVHIQESSPSPRSPVSVEQQSSKQSSGSSKNVKQISKHEPIQSLLGNHAPNDILYLICKLCGQTYGSPYGFRRHFRNQHGFEPQAHHTQVQTISETRSARGDAVDLPQDMELSRSPLVRSNHFDDYSRERTTPAMDSISPLPPVEQKSVILNGVCSNSRPSSVLSTGEGKTDSSSSGEEKVGSLRTKLSTDLEEGEERRFLSCQECGEKFQLNDFGLYKKHCRAHEKERQGKFKCTECRSSFCDSHNHTQQQSQQPHQDLTTYRPGAATQPKQSPLCHICNTFFPNSTALSQHMEIDHKLQQRTHLHSYDCDQCKKQFEDLQLYVKHRQQCSQPSTKYPSHRGGLAEQPGQNTNSSFTSSEALSPREDPSNNSQSVKTYDDDDSGDEGGDRLKIALDEDNTGKPNPENAIDTGGCSATQLNMVWKKKKSAIQLSQPEPVAPPMPVVINGDSKDSMDESEDMYRHKKFSRHQTSKRRDSDLESVDSSGSNKKMKPDSLVKEDDRRASSCSSTVPSPVDSLVRSNCSSPGSAAEESSVKADFKKHLKFVKGMKYVSGLNIGTKNETSSVLNDQGNAVVKSEKDQTKLSEGTDKVKRDKKDRTGKKGSGEKTEARHQLPFVWDRVTRSKTVKHAKK